MLLVDTSIWIELLNGRLGSKITGEELVQFAVCSPVLQEVCQGLRDDPRSEELRESLLALPCLGDPLHVETYLHAAQIFRQGRRVGCTIRSSIDCLIAAIAIENRVPVWHRDRDFRAIAQFTTLTATERR